MAFGAVSMVKHQVVFTQKMNDNMSNGESKELTFYLHAGPPKTGTTTLQCSLPLFSSQLKQDGFVFIGKVTDCPNRGFDRNFYVNPRSVANCINSYASDNCDLSCLLRIADESGNKCQHLKRMKGLLDQAKEQNLSVIYSSEGMFDGFEFRPQFQELIGTNYHVKVVVVYRRYYQWMLSRYNSLSKYQNGRPGRSILNKWLDEGGQTIATLQQVLHHSYNETDRRIDLKGDTWDFVDEYGQHYQDVIVHSMYAPKGLLHTFVCDFLEAKKTCKVVYTVESTVHNPAVPLYPDRLAVAAYERGLLKNKSLTRDDVRQKILRNENKFGFRKTMEYPLTCISSEEMEQIWHTSVEKEKRMFPDMARPEWTEHMNDMKTDFDKYVSKGSFCNVNVGQVLLSKKWIDFFKNM